MTRVAIAGVSTRAAADSAARAGFDVISVDGYGDRDQHSSVRSIALHRQCGVAFTPRAAAAAAATLDADAVVYLSNFENDPDAVAMLAAGRRLWGNPPDVLRHCRDPFRVGGIFRAHGFPTPRLLFANVSNASNVSNDSNDSNNSNDSNDSNDSNEWLVKPFSSGGGHGIRSWRRGVQLRRGEYVQQRIDGIPGSVVFIAAAGRATVLGVSRQLIAETRFGVGGYRYCGSILAPARDPQFSAGEDVVRAAHRLAVAAAADLSRVGVNGIDFVARGGAPYPVEINPRWSASVELVERACGINVFGAHAAACEHAQLPALNDLPPPSRAVGKAIVFARTAVRIGNTDDWLRDPDVRDVPHAGEMIAAGHPVCTVLAEGTTAAVCESALVARAASIYARLDRWRYSASVPPITNQESRIKNR